MLVRTGATFDVILSYLVCIYPKISGIFANAIVQVVYCDCSINGEAHTSTHLARVSHCPSPSERHTGAWLRVCMFNDVVSKVLVAIMQRYVKRIHQSEYAYLFDHVRITRGDWLLKCFIRCYVSHVRTLTNRLKSDNAKKERHKYLFIFR